MLSPRRSLLRHHVGDAQPTPRFCHHNSTAARPPAPLLPGSGPSASPGRAPSRGGSAVHHGPRPAAPLEGSREVLSALAGAIAKTAITRAPACADIGGCGGRTSGVRGVVPPGENSRMLAMKVVVYSHDAD